MGLVGIVFLVCLRSLTRIARATRGHDVGLFVSAATADRNPVVRLQRRAGAAAVITAPGLALYCAAQPLGMLSLGVFLGARSHQTPMANLFDDGHFFWIFPLPFCGSPAQSRGPKDVSLFSEFIDFFPAYFKLPVPLLARASLTPRTGSMINASSHADHA